MGPLGRSGYVRRIAAACAALNIFGFGAVALLGASQPVTISKPANASPEQVYRRTCGYCHGANVGPILLGRKLPAASVAQIARHGLNAMPAFRPSEISDAELMRLAKWIEASKASDQEKGK